MQNVDHVIQQCHVANVIRILLICILSIVSATETEGMLLTTTWQSLKHALSLHCKKVVNTNATQNASSLHLVITKPMSINQTGRYCSDERTILADTGAIVSNLPPTTSKLSLEWP